MAHAFEVVGNRLTLVADEVTTNYAYDNANRLTSVNGQTYVWDNNSNLLSDGGQTYAYDQANHLKTVTQGGNTYIFGYNGVGDRLSQTVNGVMTRYRLDPAAGLTQVLSDGKSTYLYGTGRPPGIFFGENGTSRIPALWETYPIE